MTSVSMAQTAEPSAGHMLLPPGPEVAAAPSMLPPAAGSVGPVPPAQRLSITVADWDVMFDAVRSRLIQSVGERLGELPDVPQHSAELSASLVQAVVLDCVSALDQLHAALRQERSQRPTP